MLHASARALKYFGAIGSCVALTVCAVYAAKSAAQGDNRVQSNAQNEASPIYGITIPAGYRDWHLISVKQLTGGGGKLKQLRAQLGNDIAITAFREGKLPFPDGAINQDSSEADNQVLASGFPGAGLEASYAGSAVNAQFMVKDSRKYADSGGWGYATSRTVNLAMRRCTKPAFLATCLRRIVTTSSLTTHRHPEC